MKAHRIKTLLTLTLLSACVSTPSHEITDGKLVIKGDNIYYRTCETPNLEIKEGENWRPVMENNLPDQGKPYYLDGKYESFPGIHMWCDNIECVKYNPFSVGNFRTHETVQTGVRQPGNIPEYETREIKGNLRVIVDYFTNQHCEEANKQRAIFEFTR